VPGRTPGEAVQAYIEPLQKTISVVSKGVLIASNRREIDIKSVLSLPDPVSLNGRADLFLAFTQQYRIIKDPTNGPLRVTTDYYKYALETEDAEEIIGYHWHPDGESPIRFAHLHLGPGANLGRAELHGKAHFPTGRVAFEDVVELLIDAFGVKPDPDKSQWQGAIAKTKALFAKYKTW
jgi:hypothetical protein